MNDKKIVISRIFDASREKVWEAWTKEDWVKKWWGPKDFYAPSVEINLQVGGKYIYSMHGPKNTEFDRDMYSAGIYKEIVPMEKLVVTDFFSDKDGNKESPGLQGLPEGMPEEMTVTILFEDGGDGKTKLSIIYTPETEKEFEAMEKSGLREGWNTSLDKLAEALR